jgi:sulfatase modifying factor 1
MGRVRSKNDNESQPKCLGISLHFKQNGNQAFLSGAKTTWDDGKNFEKMRGTSGWNWGRERSCAENLAIVFICYRLYKIAYPNENQFRIDDFKDGNIHALVGQRKDTTLWYKYIFDDRIKRILRTSEKTISVLVDNEIIDFRLDSAPLQDSNSLEFAKRLKSLLVLLVGDKPAEKYVEIYAGNYADEILGKVKNLSEEGRDVVCRYLDEWRQIYKFACDPNPESSADPKNYRLLSRIDDVRKLRLERFIWPELKWRQGTRLGKFGAGSDRILDEDDPTDELDGNWINIPRIWSKQPVVTGTASKSSLVNDPAAVQGWKLLDQLKIDRLMVVHRNAGMGKTTFSHMLVRMLLEESEVSPSIIVRLEGMWPRHTDVGRPLSMLEVVCEEVAGVRVNGRKVDQLVEEPHAESPQVRCETRSDALKSHVTALLKEGRVYIFLDGFDQFSEEDRDAAVKEVERCRKAISPQANCQWIILGRPYALKQYVGQKELIDEHIYHVRLESFDRGKQELFFDYLNKCLGESVLDRVCSDRSKMERDLGIPLHLAEIADLVERSLGSKLALPKITSVAHLHWEMSETLLKRTLEFGSKHVETDDKWSDVGTLVDVAMLRWVSGVVAIQMMVNDNRNAIVYGKDAVKDFMKQCELRFFKALKSNEPEEQRSIWNLAISFLEKDNFSQRTDLDRSDPTCRSFRTRKTMEWYAAHYLTNHVTDGDLVGFGDDLSLGAIAKSWEDEQWRRCWELAFQMPREYTDRSTLIRVCRQLFAKPKPEVCRPCYLMYLSWVSWLTPEGNCALSRQDVEKIIDGYRRDFVKLLESDERAIRIREGFGKEIRPGTFLMGSDSSEKHHEEDERMHDIKLTKSYTLHQFPVTNDQYELFDPAHRGQRCEQSNKNEQPVVNVTWYQAWCFANWVKLTEGEVSLPTEAQWERACRGDQAERTAYWFGNDEKELKNHAWYGESKSITRTLEESIRRKRHENPFCLIDMHGNVCEWCSDWYAAYDMKKRIDPVGPEVGSHRVSRGGSWRDTARLCRSAERLRSTPGNRSDYLGFRLALVFNRQESLSS